METMLNWGVFTTWYELKCDEYVSVLYKWIKRFFVWLGTKIRTISPKVGHSRSLGGFKQTIAPGRNSFPKTVTDLALKKKVTLAKYNYSGLIFYIYPLKEMNEQ